MTNIEADSDKIVREIGNLVQLRRLSITEMRREDGKELLSSLLRLTNLRDLSISCIKEDETLDLQHSIFPKHEFLTRLRLKGRLERVPQWVTSLQSLRTLQLDNSRLKEDENVIGSLGHLPNLISLILRCAYEGETICFKVGGFRKLQRLELGQLTRLKWVRVEEESMPSLRYLQLVGCKLMQELPSCIQNLTRLEYLGFYEISDELVHKVQNLDKQSEDYQTISHISQVCTGYWIDGRRSVAEIDVKSKILIIGGTGYIGKYVVEAGAKAGHPTFALVLENTISDPKRAAIIESFKSLGVAFLYGDLHDHQQLVNAIKQVDIVISTVGGDLVAHQVKIIAAIKEAGNIKRFLPSEFGNDVDRLHGFVEPAARLYRTKVEIRRAVEAEGIPYTYLVSNGFAGYLNYFLNPFGDSSSASPPRDKIVILDDGNPKVVFSKQEDIAAYIIKAADDPRTLNKIVYLRPPANTLSYNEIVSLWERKIGQTLEKIYLPEKEVLEKIQGCLPVNLKDDL
ncbi:isoflavone reductase homolog PCBER-like [Coffea eugenioides]|uniref:isoflavone reductase homolog PCBER-like n=1 Tax=Coffea eugenioides TaxID=49369 RepID=UPI000F610FC8|nr:isoflavone reductase homolog PCBER-like [Coffea eugenioides]